MDLMLMNTPVLHRADHSWQWEILDYERLPFSIRTPEIYEHAPELVAMWKRNRMFTMDRIHSKAICGALRLPQNSPAAVCDRFHGLSLVDSYWLRLTDEEEISWDEVSLFDHSIDETISRIALTGSFPDIRETARRGLHTPCPELFTHGMSAKCWVRTENGYFLYKVGKKEVAAEQILAQLHIPHLHYEPVPQAELANFLKTDYQVPNGERIVRSPLMTSPDRALVPFEDFAAWCDGRGTHLTPRPKSIAGSGCRCRWQTLSSATQIGIPETGGSSRITEQVSFATCIRLWITTTPSRTTGTFPHRPPHSP